MKPSTTSNATDTDDAAIAVEVNGEARRLAAASTITDLIEVLALGGKRVAVAVNRDVVIRSRHGSHRIADGDRIEILEAVGGG